MPGPIENDAVGTATPEKQLSDTEKTDGVVRSRAQSDIENVVPFATVPELNAAIGRSPQPNDASSGDSIALIAEAINAPFDRSALRETDRGYMWESRTKS